MAPFDYEVLQSTNVNMKVLNNVGQYGTTAGLLATLLWKLNSNLPAKYNNVNTALLIILGLSSAQYVGSLAIDPEHWKRYIRYFTFFISMSLDLYCYWEVARVNGWAQPLWYLLIPHILLVIINCFAEFQPFKLSPSTRKHVLLFLYILAIIALGFLFWNVRGIEIYLRGVAIESSDVSWFFYIGWLLYGLGVVSPPTYNQFIYSVADFVNVVVFPWKFFNFALNN